MCYTCTRCLLCSTCNIKHSTMLVYVCVYIPSKKKTKKKKTIITTTIIIPTRKKKKYWETNGTGGQHMLKPDQIIANEQSSIQSASAISSSVKLPTTSTPKEKTDQIDSAPKPNPSFPSISSDDLIPVESIPSLYTDLNTDDELAEINRMEEKIFKMPSPKRSYRTRKSRRDRSGSSRRLRSRNRDNNYKFSDDESDHHHVSSPTEI